MHTGITFTVYHDYSFYFTCFLMYSDSCNNLGAREAPNVPCVGNLSAWKIPWGDNCIPCHVYFPSDWSCAISHTLSQSAAVKSYWRLLNKRGTCELIVHVVLLFFGIQCLEILRCGLACLFIHIWGSFQQLPFSFAQDVYFSHVLLLIPPFELLDSCRWRWCRTWRTHSPASGCCSCSA